MDSNSAAAFVHDAIEAFGQVVDCVGVLVIVLGLVIATWRFVAHRDRVGSGYHQLRVGLGRGILLGLEFLVAADIIRTVAATPTMQGVLILGLIVLIRTFLSMSIQIELEGRLPWRNADARSPPEAARSDAGAVN